MGKGPLITAGVEALISGVYQKYPKWKAPEVCAEVIYMLRKDNPKLPSGWPSLSTVQKVLATVRRKVKELPNNPLDQPWGMGTLDEHPISSEAVPAVLSVWKSCFEKGVGFTIREAKWAARLSGLIADTEKLYITARRYARTELMFELIGNPFDSTTLDHSLMDVQGISISMSLKTFLPLLADEENGFDQLQEVIQGKRKKLRVQETFETIKEAQNCILDVSLEHPDWQAKEVQTEVNRRLGWSDISSVQKPLEEMVVKLIEPMKEAGKCIRDVLL